jgi:eukaryotic-like serine/threonine-protein kinase
MVKMLAMLLVFAAAAGISTYLTIHLLIRSEDVVIVPALEGKEVVYALELLSDLGLDIKVKGSQFSDSIPRHHIIFQEPEAGSEIKKGRDVRLVISRGARQVVIPNLAGLSAAQARILLEDNGLHQGKLSYVYRRKRPREEVLAQYPASGASGLRGNAVDLLVSEGSAPAYIQMMNLGGMDLGQAVSIIEKQNLAVGAMKSVRNFGVANDTVMDHTPEAGYPVLLGASVDLVVNRTRSRPAFPASPADLFRYRSPPGFLRQAVRVNLNRQAATLTMFDDFITPGNEIWLIVPRDEPGTLLLYVDDELIRTVNYP